MNKTGYRWLFISLLTCLTMACDPEALWFADDVKITMTAENISAGYAEYTFATNKEAYYLIACEPARDGENPMNQQKQFMTLALDSANMEYITWRNDLLKNGEFNIAPFASHALQYGPVNYIFTGLQPDTHYWIYAFAVNPEKMQPVGQLHLTDIYTTVGSTQQIVFDYRIKGYWDYVYPIDEYGNINNRFPYVAATRDSIEIAESGYAPFMYFGIWYSYQLDNPKQADIMYGVKAVENDGWSTYLMFEEGHTYYTYISGFDGSYNHHVLYKFTWTEGIDYYFTELLAEREEE